MVIRLNDQSIAYQGLMCGIYCSISPTTQIRYSKETQGLLEARGPDSVQELSISLKISKSQTLANKHVNIHVLSTVLALRGDHVEPQPLQDKHSQSFLCWNGEAWKQNGQLVAGNDSQQVFDLLLQACQSTPLPSKEQVVDVLTTIVGPFAFVFYDAISCRIFYGRDHLGRRSLLSRTLPDGGMTFCSVIDDSHSSGWTEIATGGVHFIDLLDSSMMTELSPWPNDHLQINRCLPNGPISILGTSSQAVVELERRLQESLRIRIADIPTLGQVRHGRTREDSKIAILFSGGLDCTLLARLAHNLLPLNERIDLLNVAFENPRSMAAASKKDPAVSMYESCPDRKTGHSSYSELLRVCPGRKWRFIAIDVPYKESENHHSTIVRLMALQNTEMDLSISKALYFASRGQGHVTNPEAGENCIYSTRARVLLSGLGADELFGGYTRHRTACARHGYQGLINELDIDVQRLGQRNLGRDDRIISHWAKEVRYPYLDEDFMSWTLRLPVWEKCGFAPNGAVSPLEDSHSPTTLDPAKQALRLLAWRLGMERVATERKRAIQFGARTAKMQVGKGRKKGTDLID